MQQNGKDRLPGAGLATIGCIILTSVILAAGCTMQAPESRLAGMGWKLTGFLENGTMTPALTGTSVTLSFGDEGRITGSAGCNHYFSEYSVQGSAMTLGRAGSTLMYCSTPGVMEQESAYLRLLSTATTFTLDGAHLMLSDAGGRTILTFDVIIPPVPKPLVRTNWTLESIHSGGAVWSVIAGTEITAFFGDDGQLSGSSGCNRYTGRYVLDGSSLTVSDLGSTKMMCPGNGVMNQEQEFLNALKRAGRFTVEGDRLSLLDSGGSPLLTFRADI